jgi:hypothetical protein
MIMGKIILALHFDLKTKIEKLTWTFWMSQKILNEGCKSELPFTLTIFSKWEGHNLKYR